MNDNALAQLPLSAPAPETVLTGDKYTQLLIEQDRNTVSNETLFSALCTTLVQSFSEFQFGRVVLVDYTTAWVKHADEWATVEIVWGTDPVMRGDVQVLEELCETEYLFIISIPVVRTEAAEYVDTRTHVEYTSITSPFTWRIDG